MKKKALFDEVNPKVWTTKRKGFIFYMSKLTVEDKKEIYKKRKEAILLKH